MNKKVVLGIAGLVLGLAVAGGGSFAYADEVIDATINEEDTETNCVGNPDMNCAEDVSVDTVYDEEYWSNDDDGDPNNEEDEDDSYWAGDEAESDATSHEEETEAEPALWPMWLSLGAIGVALVAIIIFNLAGRKYKK